MVLLVGDVFLHKFKIRRTDRKICVTSLPLEASNRPFLFQPEIGDSLQFFYPFRLRNSSTEPREQMYMVFHPASDDWCALELFRDAAEL